MVMSCAMSLLLKNVAPFVAATAIVAPVWTFTKSQINVAAINGGLETPMTPPLPPGLPSPPPPPSI